MERYIDADKISKHIRDNFAIDKTKNADICFAFIDFMNWLDEQPTADVVEVIRCRVCKNAVEQYALLPEKLCLVHRCSVPYDYFCASGERRDT